MYFGQLKIRMLLFDTCKKLKKKNTQILPAIDILLPE